MASKTGANDGPAINITIWVLFVFAAMAIGLRVHARTRRHHRLGWDDYLMSLSLVRFQNPMLQFTVSLLIPSALRFCVLHLCLNCNQPRHWATLEHPDSRASLTRNLVGHYRYRCGDHSRHGAETSSRFAYKQDSGTRTFHETLYCFCSCSANLSGNCACDSIFCESNSS